jgi:hypothetical protein
MLPKGRVLIVNKRSERRLKENEIIFREANRNIQQFIEETTGKKNAKVRFYCECSNMGCKQRINISISQYGAAHRNEKQFIVVPGHEIPSIEKVIKTSAGYSLVEKTGKMPSEDSLSIALTRLATDQN